MNMKMKTGKKRNTYRQQENVVVFLLGSTLYPSIELLTRGYTHWTMAVLGGLVLLILYRYNHKNRKQKLWVKCLFGAAVITGLEFVTGCIVNLGFGWSVWDYSNTVMNVMGQICIPFTAIWYFLSIPAYSICNWMEEKAFCRKIAV